MGNGQKILEGLRNAAAGNMQRVTIAGETWVKQDAGSPEVALAKARDKITELYIDLDTALSALSSALDYIGKREPNSPLIQRIHGILESHFGPPES